MIFWCWIQQVSECVHIHNTVSPTNRSTFDTLHDVCLEPQALSLISLPPHSCLNRSRYCDVGRPHSPDTSNPISTFSSSRAQKPYYPEPEPLFTQETTQSSRCLDANTTSPPPPPPAATRNRTQQVSHATSPPAAPSPPLARHIMAPHPILTSVAVVQREYQAGMDTHSQNPIRPKVTVDGPASGIGGFLPPVLLACRLAPFRGSLRSRRARCRQAVSRVKEVVVEGDLLPSKANQLKIHIDAEPGQGHKDMSYFMNR